MLFRSGFQFAYNAYQNGGVTMSDDARWFYRPSDGILFDRTNSATVDLYSNYPYSGRVSGDGRTVVHETSKLFGYTGVSAYDPITATEEDVAVTSDEVSPATGNSWVVGLSTNGRRVLLASFAALTPDAPGPSSLGYFVRDRTAGTTSLVPVPAGAYSVGLTGDGSSVMWVTNVAPSQTRPYGYALVTRYRLSDHTSLSRELDTLYPMITYDGDASLVLYRVMENAGYNLYRLDMATGTSTLITSVDGAALPNSAGTTITLWSNSRIKVIDLDGNVLDVVDRAWNGRAPNNASSPPVVSSDGTVIAFASEATNILRPATTGYHVYVHTRTA